MAFQGLFGPTLVNNKGEKFSSKDLAGKTVLVYFSAHWCPPCQHFTPVLIDFYNNLKKTRGDFELVFASSDHGAPEFQEYFKNMPWLAIPYESRNIKEALSSKFKVQGIPTLVVLDGEGNLITSKAREKVNQDPTGAEFPWHPLPLDALLGTDFVTKGNVPAKKDLKGKVFGLYFSAHWCPPCKAFTPKLAATYEELKSQGKELELVFVSFDRNEGGFNEYLNEMPWHAIPFADEKRRSALGDHFEVEGIPALFFLDSDMNIITKSGVEAVTKGLPYPFQSPPLDMLDQDSVNNLNEEPCLVVFAEEAQKEALKTSLTPLAEEYQKAKKGIPFLLATEPEISQMVRKFANLPAKTPLLVLMDIPGQAKYLAANDDLSPGAVRTFVDAYLDKTLTPLKIRE